MNKNEKKGDQAPHITLMHELKHVEDDEDDYSPMDDADTEERAMSEENYVRSVYGFPNLRYFRSCQPHFLAKILTGAHARNAELSKDENFNPFDEKIDRSSVKFSEMSVKDISFGREYYQFNIFETKKR